MSNAAAASVQAATYGAERSKQELGAAHDTAKASTTGAQDDFQSKVDAAASEAHLKKEAAVSEGKADVEEAKATTASYLDQARGLVDSALGTAQSYVSAGQERLGATTTHSTAHVKSTGSEGPKAGGITNTLTGAAVSALETTKGVLATAQAQLAATGRNAHSTAQPHVESTQTASIKPHVEAAQATIQPHVEATENAAQPHIDTIKQSLPDSIVNTSTPSSTTATTGSNTSTETATDPNAVSSPTTITYPAQPQTESHHVTTEGGAAPPERVDDRVVDKLADGLTSTKISDATPATNSTI
ncbi:hypothetical protein BDV93DRAFT_472527 [Ceratobasidium sp. AG-I]|nr:hypothetical protein BDV93DRAFT_472527 [Ceratobasidium sp. AG-I]